MTNQRKKSDGFTLIELAIVVTIMGVLVTIIIPNYFRFADRAKNALVRENIHVIQTAVEDFSVEHYGTYPVQTDAPELLAMLPKGELPRNPFDNHPTPLAWNRDPAIPGEIAITNLPGGGYMLQGHGADAVLDPPIIGGD
ncbi:MAG: type II secretion system protein [Candidatus Latescibacterota bacterium]|nr:MAG: type II secretion system protein [Candidatus Latescibacterota bacterium]